MLALLLLSGAPARAGRVVLRIQAGNPIGKSQTVQIKTNLPQGVGTNDILNLDGLELGYDVKSDLRYVHRELTLGSNQIATFNVEIDDIWVVPAEQLTTLRDHTTRLVDLLRGRMESEKAFDTVLAVQQEIDQNLGRIQQLQQESAIGPGVQPLAHIRAYDTNLETLKRIKIDIGRLENLVLGTGQDPGGMYGDDKRSPKPERFLEASAERSRTAVVRITVENTSPTRRRSVPVRQDLPEEIREQDVMDAGGLDLATDRERGVAYVYKQSLELAPREKRTFNVSIRDKWNVTAPRLDSLGKTASELIVRVAAREKFKSVEDTLRGLLRELDAIAQIKGPETVDAQYVSFYRDQAVKLDDIETRLNRIVMALPQIEKTTKIGFKVKAPSPKSTWLIIYIILGFLAVLSVVFYFRWYGKSQAEGMDRTPGPR